MDRPKLIEAATVDLLDHPAFRLGRLVVDPLAREVHFDHKSERIEPQPMKVLVALGMRRGEVVTRDELIDCCWDGRIVGEDVINRAILLLRRIATSSRAFAIETVPKAGYRLTEVRLSRRYVQRSLFSAAAAVTVVGIALLLLRPRLDQSHPPLAVVELAPFQAHGGPLANDTAQASDSIVADMLTHSGLPVIRTRNGSVANKNSDLRLSGQMRMVGGHLEATLELDDLAQGTLLLSRRFNADPDQARALPEQIGAFAATALASTGAMMALDPGRAGNRQLTGELLRQWSTMIVFEDVLGAYRSVDRIAGQMPDSAIAQLGLAMTTAHVLPLLAAEDRKAALAKGRSAAARARLLAPNYGDVAWADCTLNSPVQMSRCERALRRAFAIDPDAPFVAAGLRNLSVDAGRYGEALQYDRLAVAAMPYMAGRLSASTMLLEMTGDRVRAERQFQDVRRWWPEFDRIFADRLEGMLDRGGVADAAAFVAAMPPDIDIIDRSAVAAIASDAASGNGQGLRSRCSPAGIDRRLGQFCLVAMVRAHDLDGAFMEANVLFPNLMGINSNEEDRLFLETPTRLGLGVLSTAALALLRQDPRFIQIAQRVGLIRYWREGHLPDFCTQSHEAVCRGFV